MTKNILLVDDDELFCRSLSFTLDRAGYQVTTTGSAEQALNLVHTNHPDLVLLDISLPGMDGREALRHFRADSDLPVIMLTARRRKLDQVLGLELGADDYITKPFDADILLARLKAVLRRTEPGIAASHKQPPIVAGDITVDPATHSVIVGKQAVDLPPHAFNLLYTLALEAGQVVSIDTLLTRVWGSEYIGESQVVYVHIRWLREKLESNPDHPRRIVTIRGVGYKLVSQER